MSLVPKYVDNVTLRAIPGPWDDYFDEGLEIFFNTEFVVSHEANRAGYRLTGPEIRQKMGKPVSIISEPSLPGGVQIPPNGQPIILLGYSTAEELIAKSVKHIHQILMNLCTNSAHTMRETGGILEIGLDEVSVAGDIDQGDRLKPGKYLKISVIDNGHGISPEIQDRIFEPFFTTKTRGEGTGMGLAVIHGLISDMDGTITVTRGLDQGAAFHVFLPKLEGEQKDTLEVPFSTPKEGCARILFVDDEDGFRQSGREILEQLGYLVVTATNGLEAHEIFRRAPESFDLAPSIQKALLRALQEKKIRPIGGREVAIDFRLVAATNRDLAQLVKEQKFREDLLYRIRAIEIKLPPLRQRGGDIREISVHKIHQIGSLYGAELKGISPKSMKVLTTLKIGQNAHFKPKKQLHKHGLGEKPCFFLAFFECTY